MLDHLHDVLEGQRLEVQPVRGVVVGADRFGITVDHDGLEARLAQRQRGMHAAVVELDALADTIGAAAQDHDLAPLGRVRLALFLVAGVHVGGGGRKLRGAGVHALEDWPQPMPQAMGAHRRLLHPDQLREARVREAASLELEQTRARQAGHAVGLHPGFFPHQLLQLRQEPGVDAAPLVHRVEVHAGTKSVGDEQDAVGTGETQFALYALQGVFPVRPVQLLVETGDVGLQAAQRLLQRFLESAADGHDLAHRLHLRGQPGRRPGISRR
jgi:hypothetical protein